MEREKNDVRGKVQEKGGEITDQRIEKTRVKRKKRKNQKRKTDGKDWKEVSEGR